MNDDALEFLRRTVDQHREVDGGTRTYDGWYPALLWTPNWTSNPPPRGISGQHALLYEEAGVSAPLVTDVHRDVDHGRVLQMGVGHPQLLIIAIDTGDNVALYGGPTYDIRAMNVAESQVWSGAAWKSAIETADLPPRPGYTRSCRP